MPQRRRKRQRLGESRVPASRLRAERPNQVWALDFQFDQTADGRILMLLHVVDEFTREALAIECERRIDADRTVMTLDELVTVRGRAPEFIRCDNGPKLTANAARSPRPQAPARPHHRHVRGTSGAMHCVILAAGTPKRAVLARAIAGDTSLPVARAAEVVQAAGAGG